MDRRYINPTALFNPEEAGRPYTQGIAAGNILFMSGQVGFDRDQKIVDGAEAQARLAWENIRALVEAAGGTLEDVVNVTVFLKDIAHVEIEHDVRRSIFPPGKLPTATVMEVSDFARPGLLMEVLCMAVLSN